MKFAAYQMVAVAEKRKALCVYQKQQPIFAMLHENMLQDKEGHAGSALRDRAATVDSQNI